MVLKKRGMRRLGEDGERWQAVFNICDALMADS
jgi:hypothetical protein